MRRWWPRGQVGPIHVRLVESASFVAKDVDTFATLEWPVEERGDRVTLGIQMSIDQLEDGRRHLDVGRAAHVLDERHLVFNHL